MDQSSMGGVSTAARFVKAVLCIVGSGELRHRQVCKVCALAQGCLCPEGTCLGGEEGGLTGSEGERPGPAFLKMLYGMA